jgi:hypothetical protein
LANDVEAMNRARDTAQDREQQPEGSDRFRETALCNCGQSSSATGEFDGVYVAAMLVETITNGYLFGAILEIGRNPKVGDFGWCSV